MTQASGNIHTDIFSLPQIIEAMERFNQTRILIIGDVMIDEYLTGDADRISPEAPVPIVKVESEKLLVGGAGNVARNITALRGQACLVGVRGSDPAGRTLEHCLHEDRIVFSLLSLDNRPTTVKTRVLARQQQVLRIDRENIAPLPADDIRAILTLAAEYLSDCGAVVVSDYGKGIVSSAFMQGLREMIKKSRRKIPVLVDPKPQNFTLYKGVSILTPNARETGESVHMPVKSPDEIIAAGQTIMKKLKCPHLLTTLGGNGMAVFESPDTIWHIPTSARQVFDVTGAGDTVIATLALGMASGLPLVHSCLLANYAAGIVVGQVGAGVAIPEQIAETIRNLPLPQISRWR